MQWKHCNIEKDVKNELEDLQSVLKIVSQMLKPTAKRVLYYCLS